MKLVDFIKSNEELVGSINGLNHADTKVLYRECLEDIGIDPLSKETLNNRVAKLEYLAIKIKYLSNDVTLSQLKTLLEYFNHCYNVNFYDKENNFKYFNTRMDEESISEKIQDLVFKLAKNEINKFIYLSILLKRNNVEILTNKNSITTCKKLLQSDIKYKFEDIIQELGLNIFEKNTSTDSNSSYTELSTFEEIYLNQDEIFSLIQIDEFVSKDTIEKFMKLFKSKYEFYTYDITGNDFNVLSDDEVDFIHKINNKEELAS